MLELRIHGLGGQGVVTMSEILALACYESGREVQVFPWFGPERTGAPVTGFIRLDDRLIRLRSQIYRPDIIIVTDTKVLNKINVTEGAKPTTSLLIAGSLSPTEIIKSLNLKKENIIGYDTSTVVTDQRLANSALLGFAAKTLHLTSLANCLKAVKIKLRDKDASIIKANLEAVTKGYAHK